MQVRLYSLMEGAAAATGTAIVIDVYRAFTTAAVAFSQGARKIILVDSPRRALELRNREIGELCMGEVDGIKVPEFDFSNSPHELSQKDLASKTLIQSTSAGTRGAAAAARRTDALYVAALVNAGATARSVLQVSPAHVSVVAMGTGGIRRSDEDEQCALYIRNLLLGCRPDPGAVSSLVRSAHDSLKFDDPSRPHFDPRDRKIALAVDSIDLTIRVRDEGGLLVARPQTGAKG